MKQRILSFMMTLIILSGIIVGIPVKAASNPTWTKISTSNISSTDAKIGAKVTFPSKVKFSKGGFYIGTTTSNMKKNAYPDSSTTNATSTAFTFLMSKYKETLRPSTTYYYQIYVVADGKEFKSPTYSFKTNAATNAPTWTKIATSGITNTDAKIGAKVTFTSNVKFSKGGFYIGTTTSNLKKNAYPDSSTTNAKSTSFTFLMSKYKEALRPGTTYYYQIYVVADGKEFKSPTYSFKTTGDANTPTWSTSASTNFKNATLKATTSFSGKVKVTKAGLYFGTTKDNLAVLASVSNSKAAATSYTASFTMSSLKKTLSPGITYYYKYYAVISGKTYYSPVYSFTTKSAENYATTTISNITKTDATVGVNISNAGKQKISQVQLQIGTSKTSFTTVKSYSLNTTATSLKYSVKLSACKYTLTAGKTYYYRIGMTIDGVKSYTTVRSFDSEPNATKVVFPLPTNQTWKSTTYEGHGGANKSAYAAVDITLSNGKSSAGYPVYSMSTGTVISDKYKTSNGQITIKYNTTLITTNGAKYTTWYVTYAHMTNITVKNGNTVQAGQQIGKVGNVGKSNGAHLHLSIGSGNGGTGWYQETNKAKAISPYFVYGFVDAKGVPTSYSKFTSTKSTAAAVNARLINNPPSGK